MNRLTDNRAAGYALLRVTLGLVLLGYGIATFFVGRGVVTAYFVKQLTASSVPALLARPFAEVLPFLELGLGALLAIGAFTVETLAVTGLLLIALTTGNAIVHQTDVVAQDLIYVVIVYLLLARVDENRWSVDGMRALRRGTLSGD
jgi:thiosulfate dehydrogenase [quinone] large subunit